MHYFEGNISVQLSREPEILSSPFRLPIMSGGRDTEIITKTPVQLRGFIQ